MEWGLVDQKHAVSAFAVLSIFVSIHFVNIDEQSSSNTTELNILIQTIKVVWWSKSS